MSSLRWSTIFQSTPPVKAATYALAVYIVKKDKISIHAAREGGDLPQSKHA